MLLYRRDGTVIMECNDHNCDVRPHVRVLMPPRPYRCLKKEPSQRYVSCKTLLCGEILITMVMGDVCTFLDEAS